jgi:PIN domain nuclease of toxin-antitoxin system
VDGNVILLDTCAVIYWTLDPEKMTRRARLAIDRADAVALSSISVWEIGIKVAREKLRLPLPISDFVSRLKDVRNANIIPVDEQVWLRNLDLKWEHRDPADRTIVATAMLSDCPLVTSDAKIRTFYRRSVW